MFLSKHAVLALLAAMVPTVEAQDGAARASFSGELLALQQQNAILEEKLKLEQQRQEVERLGLQNPLARQLRVFDERLKLMNKEESLSMLSGSAAYPRVSEAVTQAKEENLTIESARIAYTALAGLAANVAKDLGCGGKNVILYGPAHSEALLALRTFRDQLEQLGLRLKQVLDLAVPPAPDQPSSAGSTYNVATLSGPIMQSVLDLISLFHSGAAPASFELTADESGMTAVIANAAVSQGCKVYWPDQYVANPFTPTSQVMSGLQTLADLNDNSVAGKPGLQQKLRTLNGALKRSEDMVASVSGKVEQERGALTAAQKRVTSLKTYIDWLSEHITEEKDASFQAKLNQSFVKGWEELEVAVKRQRASGLPQTIEEQNRVNEMSRRVEAMKVQNDWLSKYVKDEKDLALQDRLKRTLASIWTDLDAAVKAELSLTVSTARLLEPDIKEQKQWERYSADLKELITTTTAASEAYTTFRGALLDGHSGASPLSRMLRSESLRNLMFDDKFQEISGSSIVQLKLQRITGTTRTRLRTDSKEGFSGGVVLSFVQYEPNGRLKNSGVHTAYSGFQTQP